MRLIDRFTRGKVAEEVDEELAFHAEMTIRELVARGRTPQQARDEAERRFGNSAAVSLACRRLGEQRDRHARRAEYFSELRTDLRFALRQLARAPGFTAIATVTLALGIGATAAMFSIVDAVVLRSLPFPDPARVVALHPTIEGRESALTPPEYLALRAVPAFAHVAVAHLDGGEAVRFGDLPEMIDAAAVSVDFFAVFGVRPQLGRTFTPEEDVAGGPGAAILSHRFWISRFNADPGVIGRVLQIGGTPHTIVGVMPESFDFVKGSANIWTPLALAPNAATQFGAHYLTGFARLRPSVTIEQATAAGRIAELDLARRIGSHTRPLSVYGLQLRHFSDDLVHDYRALLFILLGAVSFVLLIACSNVANLLLTRGTTRARELAVRAALGAGRGRLVRQLLAESLVLSLGGAVAGILIAFLLLRMLPLISPENVPRLEQASIDWRVLAVTLGLAVASSVLCGLAPSIRAARPDLQQTLREGGRGSGVARDRLRSTLLTAQVALTLALLVGAGLLLRSAWAIQHVDPGFEARGVLAARIVLPEARYGSGDSVVRTYATLRDEAARIPGVAITALTSVVPMSGSRMRSSVTPGGQSAKVHDIQANLRLASDGYFATMKIPLVVGRDLSPFDRADGPPVTVVSEAMVRALWPGLAMRDAIGKTIDAVPTRRKDLASWEIVGVVGDMHEAALTQSPDPEMYTPYQQTADNFWPFLGRSLVIVARLRQEGAAPESLREPLQRVIARFDPTLPIADSKSMEGYLSESLATSRMNTVVLSLLGGIALVLAMVGIYGVVSYFVSQRTREIGVRIALGGTPAAIWKFVAQRGLTPIAVGLLAGVGLSLATSAFLRAQLFGVTSSDPLTLGAVGLLMTVVALIAIYVPARRAMRVPPIVALSSE
jgi:putative ABC transport system permease protein